MKIFLSYASEDGKVAERIHQSAIQEGHSVFFDRARLESGKAFHKQIRSEVEDCELFVFLVSPHSVAKGYALSELGFAEQRWADPVGYVLPVIVSPTPSEDIPPYIQGVTWLEPRGDLVAELMARLAQLADPLFRLPPLPEGDLPETPYKHLHWFTRSDAEVFFGRGREIRQLHELITVDSPPVILLFGQSGVGKSSLLEAGLLPRLEAKHEILYLRRDPERGLGGTLARGLGLEVRADPDSDRSAGPTLNGTLDLGDAWRAAEATAGRPMVILVDQVEEAYTRPAAVKSDELDVVLTRLASSLAAQHLRPRGRLILSFRKEWLAEVLTAIGKAGLPHVDVHVEPLERDGLIEAITGPARVPRLRRKYNLGIEPQLAEIIADDLLEDRESPAAPTLQVLLSKMWDEAKTEDWANPRFTIAVYRALKRPGTLLGDFVDEQLEAVRQEFPRESESGLVVEVLADHTTDMGTAAECSRAGLHERYNHSDARLEGLLHYLQDLRLLVEPPSLDVGVRQSTRLAHDTLAPLVRRRHQDSDLPAQRARRILEHRVREWRAGAVGALLSGDDLDTVDAGAAAIRALTADEERLVAASREAVRRAVLGPRSRALADEGKRVLRDDPTRALQLAIAAGELSSSNEAWQLLGSVLHYPVTWAVLSGHGILVSSVRFDSSGARLVTCGWDGTARVWSARTGEQISVLTGHWGMVVGAEFSPDGSTVLTAGIDGSARIWDPDEGRELHTMLGHTQRLSGARFSPDGRRVVTAGADGDAALWLAHGGDRLATLPHGAGLTSAQFSPDGLWLLTASKDGNARLWSSESGDLVSTYRGHEGGVTQCQFTRDAQRVVTSGRDGTVRLWRRQDGEPRLCIQAHDGPVLSCSLSPDGSSVATAGLDGWVRVWSVDAPVSPLMERRFEGSAVHVAFNPAGTRVACSSMGGDPMTWATDAPDLAVGLVGHGEPVVHVEFSPDLATMATASLDGTARLWSAGGGNLLRKHQAEPGATNRLVLSADGSRVATWGRHGGVRIWATDTGKLTSILAGHRGSVRDVRFGADRSRIITAGSDGSARVWDPETGECHCELLGHTNCVIAAGFTPDSSGAWTASWDGTARWWSLESAASATWKGHDAWIRTASLSLDGTRLVTGGADNRAALWSAPEGRLIAALEGHEDQVAYATFDATGKNVVTASWDGTARVWSASTGEHLFTVDGHEPMDIARFSPDSTRLLTAGLDSVVRIWDGASGEPVVDLAGHSDRITSATFDASGTLILTTSLDGTARAWLVESGEALVVMLGHQGAANAGVFSGDASRAITVDEGGYWRVFTVGFEELLELARRRAPLGQDGR